MRVEAALQTIHYISSTSRFSLLGGLIEVTKRTELDRILHRIKSLEKDQRSRHDEHDQLLLSLYAQAHQLHLDIGEYDKALLLAGIWLEALDYLTSPEEAKTGVWMALSENHWLLGNYTEALHMAFNVVSAIEQDSPQKETLLADAYNNIAVYYNSLGEFEKSLGYNLKALSLREQKLPLYSQAIAQSYNNLAETYRDLSNYSEALKHHQKALKIWEKTLTEDHPDMAASFNNIAAAYAGLGDYQKSLEYNLKALAIREKRFITGHPALAESYNNLASNLNELGDTEKALQYMRKAIAIFEKVLPDDHPNLQLGTSQ